MEGHKAGEIRWQGSTFICGEPASTPRLQLFDSLRLIFQSAYATGVFLCRAQMEGDVTTGGEPIRFRASKKRRAYRQRADEDDNHATNQAAVGEAPDAVDKKASADEDEDDGSAVQAALKLRTARRGKIQGVSFTATSQANPSTETSIVVRPPEELAKSIPDRFMHQTGLAMELNDKHMYVVLWPRLQG